MSNQKTKTDAARDAGQISYSFKEGQFVRLYCGRPERVLFEASVEAARLVANLTPEERAYATDEARGEYVGFAALHDLCDANMLLPGAANDDELDLVCDETYIAFCNSVMCSVNHLLLSKLPPIRKGQRVFIRSEWRDEGDDEFIWEAIDDEEKGRVTISGRHPDDDQRHGIEGRQTVETSMLVPCVL